MADGLSHRAGVLNVLAAALLWGTTGTASALAPAVSPLAMGAASMGVGGLLLAATAVGPIRAQRDLVRRHWRLVAIGGVLVALYALAFYTSMRWAGVAIGTTVTIGAAPLFAALLEWMLDGRRLSRRWAVAVALGVGGMAALSLSRHESAGEGLVIPGIALGLLAAACYAGYSWTSHRLTGQGAGFRVTMGATFGAAAIPLLLVLLATGGGFTTGWGAIAAGVYLSVVPMFLGYLLFGRGLQRIGPGVATAVTLAEVVVAAVLASLVLHETLSWVAWAGIVLILTALVLLGGSGERPRENTP